MMDTQLQELKNRALREVENASNLRELLELEIKFLGRKGELTAILRRLSGMSDDMRKRAGQASNAVKADIERAFEKKKMTLEEAGVSALASAEWIDATEPGIAPPEGHMHITSRAISEITAIFERIGFTRVRHPEVDWDWYAFESLNMPADHPARDEWETFFIASGDKENQKSKIKNQKFGAMVLTPHTSNGQVREMEKGKLPIRMINISKCYRRQSDVSHSPVFHQFEGLLIDREVSVAHLKGTLDYFAREFFGPERRVRLRPFHFRFTEPSFEVDVSCAVCNGTGFVGNAPKPPLTVRGGADGGVTKCRLCKSGWLELGGAGMVHPFVLKAGKIDPKQWSGFAFGWGVERTFMMKSGLRIDDIRVLYGNDMRFLKQF